MPNENPESNEEIKKAYKYFLENESDVIKVEHLKIHAETLLEVE